MAFGYQGKLYILAFDHRGSFQKNMFGIQGDPQRRGNRPRSPTAKRMIFEGMLEAVQRGAQAGATGVLVDEQFGSDVPQRAHEAGLRLAMPVEKSGQPEFDFEYGEDFAAHIERFNPDFSKVLVRYNPDDPDTEMNARQLGRLKQLAGLAPRQRPQVPVRAARTRDRGPARLGRRQRRPLRRRAASRADAPRDRGNPGLRDRGRHLEDRGRRRPVGR